MDRERQSQHSSPPSGSQQMSDPDREAHRERLRGLSDRADRVLDTIEAGDAEIFLQRHRQRGAQ